MTLYQVIIDTEYEYNQTITSQNTMYCGGEPEASYMKRHIAYIF